jgi:hypothetical protein
MSAHAWTNFEATSPSPARPRLAHNRATIADFSGGATAAIQFALRNGAAMIQYTDFQIA